MEPKFKGRTQCKSFREFGGHVLKLSQQMSQSWSGIGNRSHSGYVKQKVLNIGTCSWDYRTIGEASSRLVLLKWRPEQFWWLTRASLPFEATSRTLMNKRYNVGGYSCLLHSKQQENEHLPFQLESQIKKMWLLLLLLITPEDGESNVVQKHLQYPPSCYLFVKTQIFEPSQQLLDNFWFSRLGVGSRICTSKMLPGDGL